MTHTIIEWDEAKNKANQRKHGVSFETAGQVFRDPFYVSIPDRIVDGEQRWHSYGVVGRSLLLMVVNTVREELEGSLVEVIRIISARRATQEERRMYEN